MAKKGYLNDLKSTTATDSSNSSDNNPKSGKKKEKKGQNDEEKDQNTPAATLSSLPVSFWSIILQLTRHKHHWVRVASLNMINTHFELIVVLCQGLCRQHGNPTTSGPIAHLTPLASLSPTTIPLLHLRLTPDLWQRYTIFSSIPQIFYTAQAVARLYNSSFLDQTFAENLNKALTFCLHLFIIFADQPVLTSGALTSGNQGLGMDKAQGGKNDVFALERANDEMALVTTTMFQSPAAQPPQQQQSQKPSQLSSTTTKSSTITTTTSGNGDGKATLTTQPPAQTKAVKLGRDGKPFRSLATMNNDKNNDNTATTTTTTTSQPTPTSTTPTPSPTTIQDPAQYGQHSSLLWISTNLSYLYRSTTNVMLKHYLLSFFLGFIGVVPRHYLARNMAATTAQDQQQQQQGKDGKKKVLDDNTPQPTAAFSPNPLLLSILSPVYRLFERASKRTKDLKVQAIHIQGALQNKIGKALVVDTIDFIRRSISSKRHTRSMGKIMKEGNGGKPKKFKYSVAKATTGGKKGGKK